MVKTFRYTEMRPAALSERLATKPIAIVPWGALEWHGAHLPFGLDGLVAEAFSERLADSSGAVLLPTFYLPITSLPHSHSLSLPSETVREVWASLFDELARAGFELICLVSGHYAQGHEWVLTEVAETFTRSESSWVLAGTPLSLLEEPELLDHAGRYETSQLLALRPDLVELDALEPDDLPDPHRSAVLGGDPREATAVEGEELIALGVQAWTDWIDRLVASDDPAPLFDLYERRRRSYQSYVDRYYEGSWEAAIQDWWEQAGTS